MAITNTALTAPERAAKRRAARVSQKSPESRQYIRSLLPQTSIVTAPTSTLAAYIGVLIVRRQFDNTIEQTVRWSLAMFNVTGVGSEDPVRTIEELALNVDNHIEDQITVDDEIPLALAAKAVEQKLKDTFGNQVRITGWLPGYRVGDNGRVLELSGSVCPSCQTNPTGYRSSTSERLHCLNGEDCGWASA